MRRRLIVGPKLHALVQCLRNPRAIRCGALKTLKRAAGA